MEFKSRVALRYAAAAFIATLIGIALAVLCVHYYKNQTASGGSQPLQPTSITWESDGSPSNIQFIHDTQAQDGDTITLPATTVVWASHVVITKGITIQGQTAVNSDTGVCDDQTKLVDNLNPNYPGGEGYFHCQVDAGKSFRISGITFTGTGGTTSTKYNGAVRVGGNSTAVRLDHLHFDNLYHANYVAIYGNIHGVSDHVVETNLHSQLGQNRCFNGVGAGGYGDEVFSQPAGYGGPDFFFFEDWYADNSNGAPFSANGGWDADSGGKFVVRHSQLWNIEILCHGTEGSRAHGGRAQEIYNNAYHFNYLTGLDGIRSGTMLTHDNTFDGIKPLGYGLQTYRLLYRYGSIWGGANGANPWDYNVTEPDGVTHIDGHPSYRFDTGTVTGWTNNGGNGTLTAAAENWTPHRFRGYEVSRTSDGITFAISDNTATTLSTLQWGDGCCIQNFVVGDTFEIRKSLMCNDQPGLGAGDLISGSNPTPAWRHQVREGNFSWNNVYTPTGEHINWNPHVNAGVNGQLEEGRDFHSDTPMPGYTPYTYPHPLVTGGQPSPTPTAVPTATSTATPTATIAPTVTPTSTPTVTATATATATSTATYTPTPSATFTPTASATFTPTVTATATFTPTATSTPTVTATATFAPTVTPTATAAGTPNPPANLSVAIINCRTVMLKWKDTNNNEDLTQIWINTNNSGWVFFSQVGANITTKTETGLVPGKNYAFKVRAHAASGYSVYSNIPSVTMPPCP